PSPSSITPPGGLQSWRPLRRRFCTSNNPSGPRTIAPPTSQSRTPQVWQSPTGGSGLDVGAFDGEALADLRLGVDTRWGELDVVALDGETVADLGVGDDARWRDLHARVGVRSPDHALGLGADRATDLGPHARLGGRGGEEQDAHGGGRDDETSGGHEDAAIEQSTGTVEGAVARHHEDREALLDRAGRHRERLGEDRDVEGAQRDRRARLETPHLVEQREVAGEDVVGAVGLGGEGGRPVARRDRALVEVDDEGGARGEEVAGIGTVDGEQVADPLVGEAVLPRLDGADVDDVEAAVAPTDDVGDVVARGEAGVAQQRAEPTQRHRGRGADGHQLRGAVRLSIHPRISHVHGSSIDVRELRVKAAGTRWAEGPTRDGCQYDALTMTRSSSEPTSPVEPASPAALPSVGVRVLAFVAIVIAGVCGGLIGYAVTDIQIDGDGGWLAGLGGI